MQYRIEAMDATGLERRETIEADSEEHAAQKVRQEMGMFVTRIECLDAPAQRKPHSRKNGSQLMSKALAWVCVLCVVLVVAAAWACGLCWLVVSAMLLI